MLLSNNFKKNNIIIKSGAKDRWSLLEEMIELSIRNKEIQKEDKESVLKALVEREKSMSTGIGNGVAIPHCTTGKVHEISIIMGISERGIDFKAIDNNPVRIIILILVPKNKLTQHIKTLANIAKMMSDEQLREKILSLKTADSLFKLLKNYDAPKK